MMAVKSFVLLKNLKQALPLNLPAEGKLCVFGAGSNITVYGNYANVGNLAMHNVTYLGGLRSKFGADKVVYLSGCVPDPESCSLLCAKPDTAGIAAAVAQCSASVAITGTFGSNATTQAICHCL